MGKMTELAKQIDDHFEALQHVISYLHYAESEYLGGEFLDSFLQDYLQNQDVMSALHHARREWDL